MRNPSPFHERGSPKSSTAKWAAFLEDLMMEEQITEETSEWVSGVLEEVRVWRADGLAAGWW